ncbi:MAG: DnaJ domain-containing protein [Alphaproteobacteria bacterium]|nr:DnaJ domain-containing protein [Alphaproteobacteria bacterium]
MLAWVLGGTAAVLVVITLANSLANINPARIAIVLRWAGLVALALLGAVLVVRRVPVLGFLAWSGALLIWRAMRRAAPAAPGGRTSSIDTEWVRMELDLDSGETKGVVLKGAFAGRRLESLSLPELRSLRDEARAHDPEAARLIEAYIARIHPDAAEEQDMPASPPAGMTRDEALAILGLEPDASPEEIRAAHRRLVQQMHPDKGGSDYLAGKINAARDVLLKDATA